MLPAGEGSSPQYLVSPAAQGIIQLSRVAAGHINIPEPGQALHRQSHCLPESKLRALLNPS